LKLKLAVELQEAKRAQGTDLQKDDCEFSFEYLICVHSEARAEVRKGGQLEFGGGDVSESGTFVAGQVRIMAPSHCFPVMSFLLYCRLKRLRGWYHSE